jgi:hypothetical protein
MFDDMTNDINRAARELKNTAVSLGKTRDNLIHCLELMGEEDPEGGLLELSEMLLEEIRRMK